MEISRGFLNMASAVKLISGLILIGIIFSILPTVCECMPTSHPEPCIVTLDVCHTSTSGIQKNSDTLIIPEVDYLCSPWHSIGSYTTSSFTASPLLVVFQEYPPPESAS